MTEELKPTPMPIGELTFIDDTFLTTNGFLKESEILFSKLVGKDLNQEDLKFYIERKLDWDTEMGQCYEFCYGKTKLLLAYCTDKEDFISVFKTFNV
jgi:hypothetical protein